MNERMNEAMKTSQEPPLTHILNELIEGHIVAGSILSIDPVHKVTNIVNSFSSLSPQFNF